MPERVPPNNLEAETCVLGSAMSSVDQANEITSLLKEESFYSDANRRIFGVIRDLVAEGDAPELEQVAIRLKALDRLDQVGGTPYLMRLASVPFVSNIEPA